MGRALFLLDMLNGYTQGVGTQCVRTTKAFLVRLRQAWKSKCGSIHKDVNARIANEDKSAQPMLNQVRKTMSFLHVNSDLMLALAET